MPQPSEAEMQRRRRDHEEALASVRLEGLEPDPWAIAQSERAIRGETTLEEVIAAYLERVKRGEHRS